MIEQLRKLLERTLNLVDIFVTILDFSVCCSGLTIPCQGRELWRLLVGKPG